MQLAFNHCATPRCTECIKHHLIRSGEKPTISPKGDRCLIHAVYHWPTLKRGMLSKFLKRVYLSTTDVRCQHKPRNNIKGFKTKINVWLTDLSVTNPFKIYTWDFLLFRQDTAICQGASMLCTGDKFHWPSSSVWDSRSLLAISWQLANEYFNKLVLMFLWEHELLHEHESYHDQNHQDTHRSIYTYKLMFLHVGQNESLILKQTTYIHKAYQTWNVQHTTVYFKTLTPETKYSSWLN